MNRRSFFGAMAAAPVAISCAPVKGTLRVSCLKDDPGYRAWCEALGDDKVVKVYLDGIEQKDAVTADESEGSVYRFVRTAEGNLAIGHDEILHETVYGDVRIEIV